MTNKLLLFVFLVFFSANVLAASEFSIVSFIQGIIDNVLRFISNPLEPQPTSGPAGVGDSIPAEVIIGEGLLCHSNNDCDWGEACCGSVCQSSLDCGGCDPIQCASERPSGVCVLGDCVRTGVEICSSNSDCTIGTYCCNGACWPQGVQCQFQCHPKGCASGYVWVCGKCVSASCDPVSGAFDCPGVGTDCCPIEGQSLCAAIFSDPNNCGGCGVNCLEGELCVSGACTSCGNGSCESELGENCFNCADCSCVGGTCTQTSPGSGNYQCS